MKKPIDPNLEGFDNDLPIDIEENVTQEIYFDGEINLKAPPAEKNPCRQQWSFQSKKYRSTKQLTEAGLQAVLHQTLTITHQALTVITIRQALITTIITIITATTLQKRRRCLL